jgi:hypothetical protein
MKLYRLIDENNPGEIEYIATPIEITEEEIEEILAKGRLYMSVPDVRYKFIAQAILRKLKGE